MISILLVNMFELEEILTSEDPIKFGYQNSFLFLLM